MSKWKSVLLLTLLANAAWAESTEVESTSSPTGFLIIGGLLLLVIIFILYNRQKRKFND
ncbi:LPXTG cell wall anchor domain-containing protein [Sphingobacterium pedocola]|uniref:LPXTG cell wall anchor domain-containing protein n=1 Tax=Sphingobacterium pedocola TaxID=2082722 RepID=UPI0018C9A4F4|nr:LPXTG cell wall anchor domain-containing protein [Sphingobacterium pedocola]